MKALLSSDLHLTELFSAILQRSQDSAMNELVEIYHEQQCSMLVIAGDIIHDKNYMYHSSLIRLEKFIADNPDIQFVLLIGNHDYTLYPKNHGFHLLPKAYSNVHVIDETLTEEFDGVSISFVPHSPDIIDQIQTLQSDVLISHFGVSDAQVMPGLSLSHRITMDMLSKFQRVYLGHYHLPQLLTSNISETEVRYIGSPAATSWHEKNQEKRVLIFDTDDLSSTSIPLQSPLQFLEFTADTPEELEELRIKKQQLKEYGHFVRIKSSVPLESDDLDEDILVDAPVEESELQTLDLHKPVQILEHWLSSEAALPADITLESVLEAGEALLEEAAKRNEDESV